jgi:hypothetical protein
MAADVALGAERTELALRCDLCGVREPVRTPARIHGWQRCAHCGGINVAPWSRGEALDGPAARTVVIQRRGRAHFMVPRKTLLTNLEVCAWLFLIVVLGGFAIATFELEADPYGTWRWLGPLLMVLGIFSLCALTLRRWSSVQHLEISPNRMVAYRTLGSRVFAGAERSLRGRSLLTDVRRPPMGDNTLADRFCVALRPEGDERPPLTLTVGNELEGRWVEAMARVAADPSRPGSTRCCGCGAPLELTLEQHAAGGVECPYCRAGYVVAARRIHWPALRLPPADDVGAVVSRSVRHLRRHGERRWVLLPRQWPVRLLHAAGMLYGVALFGVLGSFMVWALPNMPEGTIGLRIWGAGCAAALLGMAGAQVALIVLSLFGREEIAIDEASVRVASRVWGLRWARPQKLDTKGDAEPLRKPSTEVPILRLTHAELLRQDADTRLVLHTPNRRLVFGFSLGTAGNRWLARELVTEIRRRARALGREVA